MDERTLYEIIDSILNHAEPHELEVIRAALRKREGGAPSEDGVGATFGQNIGRMANDMASKMGKQVGASEEQIRGTIRGFVKDMIQREAPELGETKTSELLDEWVPGMGGKAKHSQAPAPEGTDEGGLPGDVVLTMVRQFAAFVTGVMTVVEENSLKEAMPDWQRRYWQRFSGVTRKLITLYVKGAMSEQDFWAGISDELGLDAGEAPSGDSTGSPSPP